MNLNSIKDVLDRHRKWLISIPGVEGVAVGLSRTGNGKPCIQLYVSSGGPPPDSVLEIDGHKVEIIGTKSGFHPRNAT